MSPAQLHRHPSKEGYVGTAVDVWAAGVLLSVMLLGAPRLSWTPGAVAPKTGREGRYLSSCLAGWRYTAAHEDSQQPFRRHMR
jgi:serine/threonine protein kinase